MLRKCPICKISIENKPLKQICCSPECAGKNKRGKINKYRILQKRNGSKWAQKMHEAKKMKKISRA